MYWMPASSCITIAFLTMLWLMDSLNALPSTFRESRQYEYIEFMRSQRIAAVSLSSNFFFLLPQNQRRGSMGERTGKMGGEVDGAEPEIPVLLGPGVPGANLYRRWLSCWNVNQTTTKRHKNDHKGIRTFLQRDMKLPQSSSKWQLREKNKLTTKGHKRMRKRHKKATERRKMTNKRHNQPQMNTKPLQRDIQLPQSNSKWSLRWKKDHKGIQNNQRVAKWPKGHKKLQQNNYNEARSYQKNSKWSLRDKNRPQWDTKWAQKDAKWTVFYVGGVVGVYVCLQSGQKQAIWGCT